jgi:hypothetical protein
MIPLPPHPSQRGQVRFWQAACWLSRTAMLRRHGRCWSGRSRLAVTLVIAER